MQVVIESSSAWHHIYEHLFKRYQIVLSNPVKMKAIASAKVKADRLGALTLANLLRGGYVAESRARKTLVSISCRSNPCVVKLPRVSGII